MNAKKVKLDIYRNNIGWGIKNDVIFAGRLMYVKLYVIGHEECKERLKGRRDLDEYKNNFGEGLICTWRQGKGCL